MSAARKDPDVGPGPSPGWDDDRLVTECLRGREQAWSALVDKYKNLIYAVALRGGLPPDEAADVFQAVWMDVCRELPKLRKKGSVRAWLVSITRHKCYHWRHQRQRFLSRYTEAGESLESRPDPSANPGLIEELERDQLVRDAINGLPPRCRELVLWLFYSDPPRSYREVAEELGLAIGSIGFLRGRCLEALERSLARNGVV